MDVWNSPLRSRARAGTLPSRLTTQNLDRDHKGSLALLSPDNDEVVRDWPSTQGSSLNPNKIPAVTTSMPPPSVAQAPSMASTPAEPIPQPSSSSFLDVPMGPPLGSSPLSGSSTPGSHALANAMGSRLRSGSLNLLPDSRPSLYPSLSGSSIWSNSKRSSLIDGDAPIPFPPVTQPYEPLQPFMHELNNKTDPSRIRSYTINAMPREDDPYEHLQPMPPPQMHPAQQVPQASAVQQHRQRAQTVSVPYYDYDIPLGPQPHQQHAAASASTPPQQVQQQTQPHAYDEEKPSRSLWLGKLPPTATPQALHHIFSAYGTVESARILTHKNCGFINFADAQSALHALQQLNGKEFFPGAGPCRVGFAKLGPESVEELQHAGSLAAQGGVLQPDLPPLPDVPPLEDTRFQDELLAVCAQLGPWDLSWIAPAVQRAAAASVELKPEISAVPEQTAHRIFDSARLRDLGKRLDARILAAEEIETVVDEILPEVAQLAADYLGNTVVQKLFEAASDGAKDRMLEQIAPHLAAIGIHKNGTWAAQKIIDVARTPHQRGLIVQHLRPYTVHLFLDQFGNYVLQGCLKFGAPWSDFVYETMLARFSEIGLGRFGSRAMRACLESAHASRDQQRMVAAAIVLHAPQLAVNPNGALLLTWYLDTCVLPHRHKVLAPRLVPHIVVLATHKLAALTALKLLASREAESRDLLLSALLEPLNLHAILSDQIHGPTFVLKVLMSPYLEGYTRQVAVDKVRAALMGIKTTQAHRRLMDEVGLVQQRSPKRQPLGYQPAGYRPDVDGLVNGMENVQLW
ncbi:Pumilio domain-containing protein [Yarrowia sp. B02]|nr:Pumilio domain-containing protein [Yarrowia sp. B02]